MPPGSDVRCNYSFHMATEFTASRALMSGLSPLFSLLWVTPLPTPPITGLWHHFHSLCICLFLSVLWWTKNLKLKPVLGQSLNNVDINQSKQESNLQTSSVLMRVLHSSLHMFSVRSWNRLVYGRCCCLKDPIVAAKHKHPKWNL